MEDYGAKGSPKGYDVLSTVDFLQQFNSSWPLLKVGLEGNYTGVVTHDLGYPPFHIITTSTGQVDQNAGLTDNYGVSNSVLQRTNSFIGGTPKYFIFRLNLEENFIAPILSGGSETSNITDNYGYKVARPGKSIQSNDYRDYSLHSSTRSLMVQRVANLPLQNTGGGLGWELTVSHGLSYVPEAFAFIKPSTNGLSLNESRYCIIPPSVGAAGGYYTVSSSSVYVTLDSTLFTGSPIASVVVLKDPLQKEDINISYP